ncbi:hypothetical protein BRADI_2g39143v3 [Brachypodium distachyon]|uniref:Uncharacterized protein n=1 Tax=Brachypodium distachyon TaxID=15368 RepID=A0A2K2DCT7_BRADI|nr:hypothetical protein BRADI_2g39143v3 [Brachypodium distachyon]
MESSSKQSIYERFEDCLATLVGSGGSHLHKTTYYLWNIHLRRRYVNIFVKTKSESCMQLGIFCHR